MCTYSVPLMVLHITYTWGTCHTDTSRHIPEGLYDGPGGCPATFPDNYVYLCGHPFKISVLDRVAMLLCIQHL